MELYIANTTRQHHDFTYRLPEKPKLIQHPIAAGKQIRIDGLDTDAIDAIVAHHAVYGMLAADEAARVKAFTGLVYSVGKPVSLDNMTVRLDDNDQALVDRATQARAAGIAAAKETLQETASGSDDDIGDVSMELREAGKAGESEKTDGFQQTISTAEPNGNERKPGFFGGGKKKGKR